MHHRILSFLLAFFFSISLGISTASASVDDEMPAFAPAPLAAQSGAAALVTTGFVLAGYQMTPNLFDSKADFEDLLLGLGVTFVAPLIATPLAVNTIGNRMGYESQHLGAYLGSLAGGVGGLLLSYQICNITGNEWFGLATFTLGVAAFSVLGYHLQVRARGADSDSQGEALQALDPNHGHGQMPMMNWQMRF